MQSEAESTAKHWRMRFSPRVFVATALFGYAGLAVAPVLAAPAVAVHRTLSAPVALPALGRSNAPLVHLARPFVLRSIVVRPFFAPPLAALRLNDAKYHTSGFTGLLPRLAFAAILAPRTSRRCAPARPSAPITVLPLTPFSGSDCFDDAFAQTSALPPTSLVAAHDKHALYAPTYTPKDDLH